MLAFLILLLSPAPSEAFFNGFPRSILRDYADVLVTKVRNEELNDPKLYPATREFGPTVINMRQLPIESELVKSAQVPWSSWWFPRIDRDLFDDGNQTSPLEKYDLVRSTYTAADSRAAIVEQGRWAPDAPKWEGLCDAWAIASLVYPEPKKTASYRLDGGFHRFENVRVNFSISDQKALLLKTMEAIPTDGLKVYGQKFTGDFENWIYPDLFPQELHRFVEKQLFEKKQPFVMDHDPGVEVWNEPVYKANYVMQAVPGRDDAVFVRLFLYSAAPLRKDEKERAGTKEISREYNYFLYGKRDANGNLVVDSGIWSKGDLVDSRRDHPDYVFTIPDTAAVIRKSFNPEVDPAIVDQIVPVRR
jgi:hypothetical protein